MLTDNAHPLPSTVHYLEDVTQIVNRIFLTILKYLGNESSCKHYVIVLFWDFLLLGWKFNICIETDFVPVF